MSDKSIVSDTVKTLVCAGVGAMAVTYDKAKDTMETLVKRGEEVIGGGEKSNEKLKFSMTVEELHAQKSEPESGKAVEIE